MFLVLPQLLLRWWDGAWGLFLRMLTSNPVALSRLLYGAVQSLSSEEGTSARRLQWLTKKLCGPWLVCLQKYLLPNLHDCQHFGEICFADFIPSVPTLHGLLVVAWGQNVGRWPGEASGHLRV